jgi:hypothetical protein
MHFRRAILESLRAQLKSLPGYGGVWIQRSAPQRVAYPAITLFADNETSDLITIHEPREQERILTISIIVWIQGTPDGEKTDEDMDNAALDIERILRKPAKTLDFYLFSTDFQYSENDPEINAVTLTYKAEYVINEFNPVY